MFTALRSIALLIGLTILLAACSSSDPEIQTNAVASLDSETAAGEATATADLNGSSEGEVDPEQAALEFSQCMRDEGLDFPDIGLDANGNPDIREGFEAIRGQDGFRDSVDACSDFLAGAGFGGGRAALTENVELQDALVEFSACVRDQGFDVGDLQLGVGPGTGGAGPGAGDGQGANQQGGRGEGGFDPGRRLADGLGLDADDPAVQAAIADCQPVLDEAFSAAGIGGR